jgi:hypothetical protein
VLGRQGQPFRSFVESVPNIRVMSPFRLPPKGVAEQQTIRLARSTKKVHWKLCQLPSSDRFHIGFWDYSRVIGHGRVIHFDGLSPSRRNGALGESRAIRRKRSSFVQVADNPLGIRRRSAGPCDVGPSRRHAGENSSRAEAEIGIKKACCPILMVANSLAAPGRSDSDWTYGKSFC